MDRVVFVHKHTRQQFTLGHLVATIIRDYRQFEITSFVRRWVSGANANLSCHQIVLQFKEDADESELDLCHALAAEDIERNYSMHVVL